MIILEDEGTKSLRNVANYSANYTASHATSLLSSVTSTFNRHILLINLWKQLFLYNIYKNEVKSLPKGRNWNSEKDVGWMIAEAWFDSRQGQGIFLWDPLTFLFHRYWRFSLEFKRRKREAIHLRLFIAEVDNAWRYTSTSVYFITLSLIKFKDILTCYWRHTQGPLHRRWEL